MSGSIPTACAVELHAIAMNAALGVDWKTLDRDTRQAWRAASSGGLMRLAIVPTLDGAGVLAWTLDETVGKMRRAAEALEGIEGFEDHIRDLFSGAADVERIGRLIRGLAPDPAEEAISVFDPEPPAAADTWPEVWERADAEGPPDEIAEAV